jgi:hypothetical protein
VLGGGGEELCLEMQCCSYSLRMSWHCWLSNGIYSRTFANSIINHTWWTPFVSWQTRNTVMPFTTLRPAFICHSSKHADINTQQVHILVGVHWCIPPTFLACSQADQQHVRCYYICLPILLVPCTLRSICYHSNVPFPYTITKSWEPTTPYK